MTDGGNQRELDLSTGSPHRLPSSTKLIDCQNTEVAVKIKTVHTRGDCPVVQQSGGADKDPLDFCSLDFLSTHLDDLEYSPLMTLSTHP